MLVGCGHFIDGEFVCSWLIAQVHTLLPEGRGLVFGCELDDNVWVLLKARRTRVYAKVRILRELSRIDKV